MGSCRRHRGTGGDLLWASEAKRRMETCWRRLVMTLLCGISLFVSKTEAIKFSAEGVSVPDGVLRVNDATELGCKYIMWRQETLASVTWSIQYSGVKTDFFVYKPFHKEVKPGMSMLTVDATNSEEKMINLTLTDGQEDEVVICCDVKVLRDDGYGSMTTKQKELKTQREIDTASFPNRPHN